MKPECWGSLLVQEKYKEEMPVTEISISCNNNNNNNNNNNMGKLNHLILNTLKNAREAWYHGTAENGHTGHCKLTSESSSVNNKTFIL